MAPPLILLPPSEGKTAGGTACPWDGAHRAFTELDRDRRAVIAALRRAMRAAPDQRRKLLGVGATAAAVAAATNARVDSAPTRPAIERYAGVLYDALDYRGLPARTRARVDAQVVILSGLWGLLAPRDPIPDYKLKMSASLAPLGRLATWWQPRLSPVLDAHVAGQVVWDLLPHEHASAWRPAGTARRHITVRFLDEVTRRGQRELVTVSHWSKLLKGALVRHIITEQLTDPRRLDRFEHPQGYAYRPDLSRHDAGGDQVVLVATR